METIGLQVVMLVAAAAFSRLDTAVGDCTDITVFKKSTTCSDNSTFIITVAPARKLCKNYTSDKAEDVTVTIKAAATGTNFRLKKLCVNVENVRVADITKFTPSSSRNREKIKPKRKQICLKEPDQDLTNLVIKFRYKDDPIQLDQLDFTGCIVSSKGPDDIVVDIVTRAEFLAQIGKLDTKIIAVQTDLKELTATPSDCSELTDKGPLPPSGHYAVRPKGLSKDIYVYCDMVTDGGGWLVFQRRQDGSENFYRNWNDYQNGFGKLDGEFWLGNDVLHEITKQKNYKLRVDLEDFENAKRFAVYSLFSVADSSDRYKLSLGTYTGNAGDSFGSTNNQQFSTQDVGNTGCATRHKGAWWYHNCHHSNLNGRYLEGQHTTYADGVNWFGFRGYYYSLKFTEMKIRPV